MDLTTRAITPLVQMPDSVEDYVWVADGNVVAGKGSVLLRWRTGAKAWDQVADLTSAGVKGISRLAVSPSGDRIAIVALER